MTDLTRRSLLKSSVAGVAAMHFATPLEAMEEAPVSARKGRIQQSVSRWCYEKISLDDLCKYGAGIGLKAVDVLQVEEYEVPNRYGLICTMGYAGGGQIGKSFNRTENHSVIEQAI